MVKMMKKIILLPVQRSSSTKCISTSFRLMQTYSSGTKLNTETQKQFNSEGDSTSTPSSASRFSNLRPSSRNVNLFYNQSAIDIAASKVRDHLVKSISFNFNIFFFFKFQPSIRLTPSTIMYPGKSPDGSHILVCQGNQ